MITDEDLDKVNGGTQLFNRSTGSKGGDDDPQAYGKCSKCGNLLDRNRYCKDCKITYDKYGNQIGDSRSSMFHC